MLNEIFAGFAFLIFSSIGKSPRVIISSFGGGSRGLIVQLYRLEVGILTFFTLFLDFLGVWRRSSVQISWNHQKILPETSLLVKIKITLMKDQPNIKIRFRSFNVSFNENYLLETILTDMISFCGQAYQYKNDYFELRHEDISKQKI